MVTKEQALQALGEYHYGECKRTIGPRGGETVKQTRVRASGKCQTWKTRPSEFRLPVKYGMYESSEITQRNAGDFHTPADCPIRQPETTFAETQDLEIENYRRENRDRA